MAKLEELIGDLHKGGELTLEGGFTLDREKAREKMRQFQLADPHRYVLLLVQAANLKGATRIDFEIDTDDMRMRFDGEPLTREDLDELYTSLFGEKRTRAMRARVELALGMNAAMALNPSWAKIVSFADDDKELVAILRPDGQDSVELKPRSSDSKSPSFIHVKDRFRPGLILQFFKMIGGEIAEAKLLRERVLYCDTAVFLNGERISGGMMVPGAPLVQVQVRGADVRCVAGIDPGGGDPTITLLTAGVWLASHAVPDWLPGFVAMVDATDLRKDVSQADVVQDAAYSRMLEVVATAERKLLEIIAFSMTGVEVDVPSNLPPNLESAPPWLGDALRDALVDRAVKAREPERRDALTKALCDLPFWKRLDRRKASTAEILSQPFVSVSKKFPPEIPHGWEGTIWVGQGQERNALKRIVGGKFRDRTSALGTAVARLAKERAFRARVRAPVLADGVYSARQAVTGDGITGEVGLRDQSTERPSFAMIVDGCLLWELQPDVPLPGLVAVVQGPLKPIGSFDRAKKGPELGAVVHAILVAIHTLMDQFAQRRGKYWDPTEMNERIVLPYIEAIARDTFDDELYAGFGFRERTIKRFKKRFGRPRGRISWTEALAQLPLFGAADGHRLSLAMLAAELDKGGKLRVVSERRKQISDPPELVLRVRSRAMAALEAVFGDDSVERFGRRYAQWIKREQWRRKPKETFRLHADAQAGPVSIDHGGVQAIVGARQVNRVSTGAMFQAHIAIHKEHRHLADLKLLCPLPGVMATVNADEIEPTSDWTGVEERTAGPIVAPAVYAGVLELLRHSLLAAADGKLDEGNRGVLIGALGLPFPAHGWFDQFRDVVREHGQASAVLRFERAFEVLDAKAGKLLLPELSEIVAREPTDAETTPKLPAGILPIAPLRSGVLAAWPALQELPLFDCPGAWVSLATILESVDAYGEVLCIERENIARIPELERLIIGRGRLENSVLRRLIGPRKMADGEQYLQRLKVEQEFKARPELELELRRGDALVSVEVQANGVTGQLGLPRRRPSSDLRSSIRIANRKRMVCELSPVSTMPLVGILDGAFGAETGYVGVSVADLGRINAVCDMYRNAIIAALSKGWDGYSPPDRLVAALWIVEILRSDAAGSDGEAMNVKSLVVRRLLELPVFLTLDGRSISAAAIKRHRRGGEVWTTGLVNAPKPDDQTLVLALRTEAEEAGLDAVFGELGDWDEESQRRAAVAERARRAPPLPSPPRDALAVVEVDNRGLQGTLWLDPTDLEAPQIAFGQDGKTVESLALRSRYLANGAIVGSGVRVDPQWRGVSPRKRQLQVLRDAAFELYQQLLELPLNDDSSPEAGRAATYRKIALTRLLLRTREELKLNPKRKLKGRHGRLYRELCKRPLFMSGTGREISLNVAQRERPLELVHLDLWEGDPDPEVPAPRPEDEALGHDLLARMMGVSETPAPEPEREPEEPPRPIEVPRPKPTPEERLVEWVRRELRFVRSRNTAVLSDGVLGWVTVGAEGDDAIATPYAGTISLNRGHPVVKRVLESAAPDPILISVIASATYTALNIALADITDEDESVFHRLHAEHLVGN